MEHTIGIEGKPITSARFLGNSFFVTSLDTHQVTRIFNYKTEECLSVIQPEYHSTKVSGILPISTTQFVVLGRKLFFYNVKPIADSKPFDLFMIQSSEIDKTRQTLQKRAVEPAFDCLYCNFN